MFHLEHHFGGFSGRLSVNKVSDNALVGKWVARNVEIWTLFCGESNFVTNYRIFLVYNFSVLKIKCQIMHCEENGVGCTKCEKF